MAAMTSRRVARLAVMAALAALASTGCGGGTKTNGLEKKPAAQVQQDAVAALKAAKSVHMIGTSRNQSKPVGLDLRIQGGSRAGTMELDGARAEITTLGATTYLKAEQRAWKALRAPPPVAGFAGRWVKLRSRQLNLEGISLDSLAAQLSKNDSPLQPRVEQAKLDGNKVVVLSRQDGSKLYVANTGPPYPLRMDDKGPDAGQVDFTEHGADFHITAPGDALSNALTADERAWLNAIPRVRRKIDKAFTAAGNLTRSAMASHANALRSCRRQLLGAGAPSDRLQPVYALVKQACAQYDKGARCFTTAARVSDPSGGVIVGTPEERIQRQAIDCGTAAYGNGAVPLFDAESKGSEIKTETG
jgi:hypothetical protein